MVSDLKLGSQANHPIPTYSATTGLPATTNPSSTQSEQDMVNMIELPQDSEIAPANQFVPDQPAHYQQNQYPHPRGNGSFVADQDMQMAQELAQNMQQGIKEVTPTPAPGNDSHGQNHEINMSQTPIAPGMGPPHNLQSFSGNPGGAVEVTPDQSMISDGKRKRSKVSRACDECRRKKIRCDATDDDGSIKTCSNCARISQSCSFSRVPMKRGPSKGYIKELSERVQQVESLQMQLTGQPAGYRQSIDSEYSPEEPYSAGRRNFSFSDQRNPFASFPRDRIPSTGGWGMGSPMAPYQAQDSRGSIALAPDQHLEDVPSLPVNYTTPFWLHDEKASRRAVKRQKRGIDDDLLYSNIRIEQIFLTAYLDTIHHVYPILPQQAAGINELLENCPARLRHAFIYVLSIAQDKPRPNPMHFSNYNELEDYVWEQAKIPPSTRAMKENIVWLWLYMFMFLNCEKDVSRLRGLEMGLPQFTVVKLCHDLDTFLTNEVQLGREAMKETDVVLVRRANYIVGIFLALHALGTGAEFPTPSPATKIGSFDEMSSILSDECALLSRACSVFAILHSSFNSQASWKTNHAFAMKNRMLIEQHLSFIFASAPQKPELDGLCQQIQSFVVILLAMHTSIEHPVAILTPTLQLVDSLLSDASLTEIAPKYNPLQSHLFAIATFTILSFIKSVDEQLEALAKEGLGKVKKALEQIDNRIKAPAESDLQPMHWSSVLLRVIGAQTKPGGKPSNGTIGKDPNIDPAMAPKPVELPAAELKGGEMTAYAAARVTGHDGQGDKMMDVRNGVVQVVDMSLLLRQGYLNAVAEMVGV